jgi:hypothetical protein
VGEGEPGRSACLDVGGHGADAPLDLGADHIDDLVRQARDVLVAEVDGDAGLLLLDFSRGALGGGAEVAAAVVEGGLCEGHDLVVRDGRGRVVAHYCGRRRQEPGGAAERRADMLLDSEGVNNARTQEEHSCVPRDRASRMRRSSLSGTRLLESAGPDHDIGNTSTPPAHQPEAVTLRLRRSAPPSKHPAPTACCHHLPPPPD